MNEFEKAKQDVLDYVIKAIDNLTAEDLAKIKMIFEGVK
jgi:hypothetical protein